MDTKRDRLIFLESMAKRLAKAVGPTKSVCVGWSYVDDGHSFGLPSRAGGYGLVSVLLRPGKRHVTFAGDRRSAREVESALSGELGGGPLPSLDSGSFDLFREGWEPEWPDKAAVGAWKPVRGAV